MKRQWWLAGTVLAVSSTLALAAPESLLPPGFDNPTPTPTPRATAAPASSAAPGPSAQPLPGAPAAPGSPEAALPANLPPVEVLEKMDPDQLDELFGLKPKYDIPPGAQRSLEKVGVIGLAEGGFPSRALAGQPASLIYAALAGTKGPLVSRWGHILLRRALASRLDAPQGMDPVRFAALRAQVLDRIGEGAAARALVQDVDSANYDPALAAAAFDAYLQTGDIVGICPVAQLKGDLLATPEWQMTRSICAAFGGESRRAEQELDRALSRGIAPRIDVLLAQRFAGAAGEGRQAVTIEWNDVNEMTPWRLALTRALGIEIPDRLHGDPGSVLFRSDVFYPAAPLARRAAAADRAARDGVLSSAAMVDLYSQLWADTDVADDDKDQAGQLREAYVANDPQARLSAMQSLWGGTPDYGRQVLTAYAAARLPVDKKLANDAASIIASMLAAGLDRNAVPWSRVVDEGSLAWALLAVAQPQRQGAVPGSAVESFIGDDNSPEQRKSRFLLAGLAGLGRLDRGDLNGLAGRLGINFNGQTKWTQAIDLAGQYRNPALVSLLAGLGMQGSGWDKMTARHLFHIVRALDQAGLNAEARMIAAEAVARG
uniref:hypothetical protein n=1 Tax=Altererythrobacter segetis TaxID=1104773 RepID=UPI00140D6E73|nr:hypothetical protein [Altererythrobacter segetis]